MKTINIAARYVFSKSKGHKSTGIFLILGIGVTLCAFLVVYSVMSGLQDNQLNVFRQVKSFDISIKNTKLSIDDIKSIYGVDNAFLFKDLDVLINNRASGKSTTGKLRAIDTSVYLNNDSVTVHGNNGLCLSRVMQSNLSCNLGDYLEMTFLKKGKTELLTPYNRRFKVERYFFSYLAPFNEQYVMASPDMVEEIVPIEDFDIGIISSGNLEQIKDTISKMDSDCEIRDYKKDNETLYSALMLEKGLVICFMFMIFTIVCLNLKTATQRIIEIKRQDAGILRVLGLTRSQITSVFFQYSMILTICGEILGIVLAVLFINNSHAIFQLFDKITSLVGNNHFLSSVKFSFTVSVSSFVIICLSVTVIAVILILLGCKKLFNKDLMEVVLNASH